MRYRVRSIGRFQHYSKRRPPWIKWHRECLEDPDFMALPDASKWLAVCAVLVASASDDATFSVERLEFIARRRVKPTELDLLQTAGFIEPCERQASVPLADRQQDGGSEESRDRGEAEESTPRKRGAGSLDGFDEWYDQYPKKVGRAEAERAWRKLPLVTKHGPGLLANLDRQKRERKSAEAERRFVPEWPNPATYLNNSRWTDTFTEGTSAPKPVPVVQPDSEQAEEIRRRFKL